MASSKDMKRVTFRVTDETLDKLTALAERWGMSINALVGYIVGRWVDDNYNLQDRLIDKMAKPDENLMENLLSNPQIVELFKGILKESLEAESEAEERRG